MSGSLISQYLKSSLRRTGAAQARTRFLLVLASFPMVAGYLYGWGCCDRILLHRERAFQCPHIADPGWTTRPSIARRPAVQAVVPAPDRGGASAPDSPQGVDRRRRSRRIEARTRS